MIKVDNLNKYYNKSKSNEIHVINEVNLELPSNGLVSFLGASGSGKTTLLNVIGGLDKATGTISYDSFEMKKYEMSKIDKYRNENFGYVFQTYNLLLNETVYDNLRIALELIDIYDEKESSSRIEYALKSVDMYKYRKKRASQLSGGQQQRVAIARALVKHCKVIIADEPTGNLDSANALEVMNILKSISKKTLVLLVTHNESLANFYSDTIYKIEDGKIIDHYENTNNSSLQTTNDNVIYLKDMNLIHNKTENIDVKLYSNDNNSINIEIVERNNTFYIRSNKNIKLVDSSNIKLINDHYKPVEKKKEDNYDYDDSFFNNSIKKRNTFQDFSTGIKHSFLSFIKPTKKIKIIYASLVLLGVLFAMCAISFSNAVKVDTNSLCADDNYSTLSDDNTYYYYVEDSEELINGLKNEYISSIQMIYSRYANFTYQVNYVESMRYDNQYSQMYYNKNVNKILYGTEPKENEVAISLAIADELLVEFSNCCNTYDDLFNLTIDNGEYRLVGIVEGNHKMVYISEADYVENITSYKYVDDNNARYYKYEKKYDSYEIVMGRDLNENDFNTANILIPDKFIGYENIVGTDVLGVGFVVGVYRIKNADYSSYEIMINANDTSNQYLEYKYSYNVENYHLVEGRKPENDSECLISIYNEKEIGDSVDGYKIVGRYNGSTQVLKAKALFSTSVLSIDDYSRKVFIVDDEEKLLESISNTTFELKDMYQHEYDRQKEINQEELTIYGILGSICLIAASIMVLFLMRSKMINDIYNIGVYRSLGSSKSKIYLKYFTDTLVMVTFTSLVAYISVMFIYYTAIDSINDFWGLELFSRSFIIPLIGIVILYIINIFFGLLPIFTLLKKTPSEIIAKYDI